MAKNSKLAVVAALVGNGAIAVTKFVVAEITGSAAMSSEGIHSAIDTGNQFLLLWGMRRSRRPADSGHPFGHGKELYFWSLMVAVLIFGVGGGVSVYQGILHILHPVPIEQPKWNYLVLGVAFVFEGLSFAIALRTFVGEHGVRNILDNIIASKDPTTYTILAEDSAALVGLAIAAAGIYLSDRLKMPALDGVASILIGLLLAGVALFLIRESRGLLVGEGVDRRTEREIRKIVTKDPLVEAVRRPLTMYIGPGNVLLTLDVQFRKNASVAEVADAIDRIKSRIRARFPHIKRIYVEAETAARA